MIALTCPATSLINEVLVRPTQQEGRTGWRLTVRHKPQFIELQVANPMSVKHPRSTSSLDERALWANGHVLYVADRQPQQDLEKS
jgi:hypothetical protein